MPDAMSLSVSRCACPQRQLLPGACCGKDIFVLPMESICSLT
jgi:hypothetical protein